MSQILDGKIILGESSKKSMGGTELMMQRMIEHIPEKTFQGYQIIHSRIPDELSEDHERIMVFHDLPHDPMYDKLRDESFRNKFSKFVFVSNWQMQYFNLVHGIPYDKSVVIKNSIETFPAREPEQPETVRLIYHTTPHRGLEILIPSFNKIKEMFPDLAVSLDVYSSFEIYGWRERDEKYKDLFDLAKRSSNITYHGFKPNDVVRKALSNSHIFAYPSIWPETSCLAAIEAMSAGLCVVHPNYGALPETCGHFGFSYQWSENKNNHANIFTEMLYNTILYIQRNGLNNSLQKHIIDAHHNNDVMANMWTQILKK